MKNKFSLLVLILVSVLFGCSQDEELVYSCDQSVNKWVKENISVIQTLTRDEWDNLDEERKRATYRAFSKRQRIDFWLKKLEDVKALGWTAEERAHLDRVVEFINNHYDFFDNKPLSDEQMDQLYRFCYKWGIEGVEQFGWSTATILSIIGTGNSVINKEGKIKIVKSAPPYSSDKIDCYCHAGNVLFSTCIGPGELCDKSNCKVSSGGCGLFLFEDCNGVCK